MTNRGREGKKKKKRGYGDGNVFLEKRNETKSNSFFIEQVGNEKNKGKEKQRKTGQEN